MSLPGGCWQVRKIPIFMLEARQIAQITVVVDDRREPGKRERALMESFAGPLPCWLGKYREFHSIRGSAARQRQQKAGSNQCLTSQFPTHPNREFFAA